MPKKEDIIKQFTSIKGVGKKKAEELYDNGFDSISKLKNAKIKDLTKIDGFSEKLSEDILSQIKEEKTKETKTEKTTEKEKKEIKKETKKPKPEKTEEKEKKTEKPEEKEQKEQEEYKVKIKPKLSKDIQRNIRIRKQIKKRTPEFLREEWFRYKRVPKNWRRPDGITSKMRINKKYRPSKVRVGFRGPKDVRGLHSSGFKEIMVYNVKDLEKLNNETEAARIGSSVGTKKRMEIEKKAEKLKIRVLNI